MNRYREIQVGTVFIVAVALLVSGVLWFKEFRVGEGFQEVQVQFDNTSGLQKGDPVEVRGVSSGQVKRITYGDVSAHVTLRLDRDIHLVRGTRIVIENVGIMGQRMVAIYPGELTQAELPPGIDFVGEYQMGMGGLMSDTALALGALNRLATRLEVFLDAIEGGEQRGTFVRMLKNLDVLIARMAEFMENTQGGLEASVDSFNEAMRALHQTLDSHGPQVQETIRSANEMMVQADSTLAVLETTLTRMERLLADLENGRGSAGQLLQDEAVYQEMKATLEETRRLIEEVRENPRKFFKFSVF